MKAALLSAISAHGFRSSELTRRAIPTPRVGDWQSTAVMRLFRPLKLRRSTSCNRTVKNLGAEALTESRG
jgi:hypothetical protein